VRKLVRTLRKRLVQLRSIRDRFGSLIAKERRLLGLGACALLIETACLLAVPLPIRYITDGLLIPNPDANLWMVPDHFFTEPTMEKKTTFLLIISGCVILISTLIGIFGYLRTVWCATAGQRMVMKLRKQLYAHLHYLSLRFHHGNRIGDLMVRITGDIPMLRDILSGALIDLAGRLILMVGYVGLMFWLDSRLALASVAVLLVIGVLSAIFSKRIVKIVKKQRKQEGILAYTTNETLSALTLVKALGREDEVTRRFARQNRAAMRKGLKGTRLQASLSRYAEIIFAAGLAVVLFFGVNRVLAGAMSVGVLLQFISYLRNFNKPLRRASRISTSIGKAAACGERINEILEIDPEEIDAPDAIAAPKLSGEIEFQGVEFSYTQGTDLSDRIEEEDDEEEREEDALLGEDESELLDEEEISLGFDLGIVGTDYSPETKLENQSDTPQSSEKPRSSGEVGAKALNGIDLHINAGEIVAVVGRNGAGKSTLMSLLLRLYEPCSGELYFDGVPSPRYTIRSLRDQISIALQGTYLFGSTVKENLLFSAPEATDEEVWNSLSLVGADFVEDLPLGVDAELAEGGSNLSGGQRRKLALAGALLRKTPILILDEPTAAIDLASRDDLLRRLPDVVQGRTTMIIAHDAALLTGVDRVIYLENGQIKGDGNHEDLQVRLHRYRELFPDRAEGKGAIR